MIKLDQLSKYFGKTKAVDNISLEITDGELFCFLGPNGAGKTTTIKMIVGLMTPTAGHVIVNGINVQDEPERAKSLMAYIPDAAFLYNHLTGSELMHMVGQLFSMDTGTLNREKDALVERLHMSEWVDDRISGYSQGMKQRLVFAMAFLHNPKIIVIDEPMVGLDPKTARIIKNILKERSQTGVTLFISTHNLNVAEELADRIAIINRGRILGVGTIDSFKGDGDKHENLEALFLKIVEEEDVNNHEGLGGSRE